MRIALAVLTPVLVTALIGVLSATPAAAAESVWLRAESPDFVLIGDLPPDQAEALALSLGRFLSLLSTIDSDPDAYRPELRVVAFGTESGFDAFRPPRLRDRRGEGRVSGFFVPGRLEDHIVLDARPESDPWNTLYHESLHVFLRHQIPQVPLWLNEGLAEYYSTFTIRSEPGAGRGDRGEAGRGQEYGLLGLPKEAHVRYLDREPLMPLARLLEVRNDSPTYREGTKTGIFYAESWALVHYLMSDDRRREQTMRYLDLLGEHRDPSAAFRQAFDRSPSGMEHELEQYLRQRTFAHSRVELPAAGELGVTITELEEAQLATAFGDLLLALRRTDAASERYEQALAVDAELPAAQTGVGRTLLQRGNLPLAVTWLEEAARWEDAASPKARFLLGSALVRQAQEALTGATTQSEAIPIASRLLERARPTLRAALEIDAALAPAHAELGRSWLIEGGLRRLEENEATEGLRSLQRAAALEPDRGELVRDLAILLCRADRCGQAERAIADVLSLYHEPELTREARLGVARAELRRAAELAGGEHPEAAIAQIEALLDRADAEVYSGLQPDALQVLDIARHNQLVQAYNRALDLARAGDVEAAATVLRPVLRDARDPELLRSARQLERALQRAP